VRLGEAGGAFHRPSAGTHQLRGAAARAPRGQGGALLHAPARAIRDCGRSVPLSQDVRATSVQQPGQTWPSHPHRACSILCAAGLCCEILPGGGLPRRAAAWYSQRPPISVVQASFRVIA
jgi:hypothetical protein